jgi:hypothetical protein
MGHKAFIAEGQGVNGATGDASPRPIAPPEQLTATVGGPNEDIPGQGETEQGPEPRGPKQDRALRMEPGFLGKLKQRGKRRRLGQVDLQRPVEGQPGEWETILVIPMQSLHESEFTSIREKYTTYERSKNMGGMRVPRNVDMVRYRSELVYEATVPDSKGLKLWDDMELQGIYGVMDAIDCVEAVLLAGEKDKLVAVIEELSGFSNDLDSDTIKNS